MNKINRILFTTIVILLGPVLHAQVPQIINYQGRVLVGPTNFTGTGQFKFALVDPGGSTSFWSNDGTSVEGSEPSSAVSLSVANGLYSVLLGDTTIANMTVAIPFSAFTNSDVRLRVWFNDGPHGSQLLSPDQRIAAVGYAMIAVTAVTVPASGITGALAVTHGGTGSTTPGGALANLGAAATSGTLGQFAATSSAQLATVLSDETGNGPFVLRNSPTLSGATLIGPTARDFLAVSSDDSANSTALILLNLVHTTTGTPVNGIGAALTFETENSVGSTIQAAEIAGRLTNVTAGSEAGQISFFTRSGGSFTSSMTLDSSGGAFNGNVSVGGTATASGVMLGGVGSASAPEYSFSSDTNTGMFRSAPDTLNFATGGASRMSIDSTGVISGDGSGLTLGQSLPASLGTGSLSVPNNSAFALIPGLTRSITVPANSLVYVETDGGIQTTSASATGFSVTEIAIFVDGVQTSNGGFKRIMTANNGNGFSMFDYWSFAVPLTLTAGNHTIEVQSGAPNFAGAATATVSGNSSSGLRGKLIVIVLKQ